MKVIHFKKFFSNIFTSFFFLSLLIGSASLAANSETSNQDVLGEEYYAKGVFHFQKKEYEDALVYFGKSANLGNLKGQILYSDMFCIGLGTEKNQEKCFKWTLEASKQGHSVSQYELALMYWNGEGVTKSYPQSIYWADKVARVEYHPKDDRPSAVKLVKIIMEEFIDLLLVEAYKGNAAAQYNAAVLLYKSEGGIKTDPKKALELAKMALKQGYVPNGSSPSVLELIELINTENSALSISESANVELNGIRTEANDPRNTIYLNNVNGVEVKNSKRLNDKAPLVKAGKETRITNFENNAVIK